MITPLMLFLMALFSIIAEEDDKLVNRFSDPISLIDYCRIIETPTKLNAAEVSILLENKDTPLSPQSDTQGFSQNYFWISFDLKDYQDQEALIIELDNPHIDHVLLYQRKSKWDLVGYGGDKGRTFNNRSFLNRRYIFPVSDLEAGSEFLLMVDKRDAAVSFPLKLWDKNSFEHHDAQQNVIFGVYFGMLLILSFIAFALGVVLRQKFLWIYGIYAVAMILYMFTALGFSFQFLYPNFGSLNNYMRPALIVIIAILSTYFTRDYLSLDKSKPKISAILKGLNACVISLFAFGVIFFNIYNSHVALFLNLLYVLLFLIFICSILAGIVSLNTVKKKAIIYLSAFSAVIIGNTLYLMIEYGLLNEGDFFMNPIMIGSGVELIIFSGSMIFWAKDKISSKIYDKKVSQENKTEAQAEPILELKSQINYIQEKNGKGSGIAGQKNQHCVKINKITHIESHGHYLLIYLDQMDKPIIERMTFDDILALLPDTFIRIHRGYVVHTDFVTKYNSTHLLVNYTLELPISRTYKKAFFEYMTESVIKT
jgi:hypothetical protein